MKKILLGLFLVVSALSFSAGKVLRDEDVVFKEGLVYVKSENNAYTGTLEGYNERGVLETRKEFKNGKVLSEATFKDGNQVGVQKDYYEDGKIKAELPYKNDVIEGIMKEYYPNGKLKSNISMKNGKRDGLEKIYYENGKLKYELNYKNGTPYGNMKLYDENGNFVADAPYVEVTTK